MKRTRLVWTLLITVAAVGRGPSAFGATVTSFSFDQLVVGINNGPTPSAGTGSAMPLGMTNNFTTPPSVTSADILADTGTSNPGANNRTWRVCGGGAGSGNGWAAAAPQYSQGAEFRGSTVGFKDIVLTYDWSPTTQGVKHHQVQYTANGTTWTNGGPLQVGPATELWVNGISVDLSAIAAVNNNPQFGVRIVSAYAPTGPNASQYVNLAGNVINSTSGNWRFDTITFSGNAVPEPAALVLIGLGVAGCAAIGRRRRRKM